MKETRLLIMIMSCLEQQQYPILSSRACFSNPQPPCHSYSFCEESLAFRFIYFPPGWLSLPPVSRDLLAILTLVRT